MMLGIFALVSETIQPLYLHFDGTFREVRSIAFTGNYVAKEYIINWLFAAGHVIEDALNQETVYKTLYTEGLDWKEFLSTQNYIVLSPEDYKRHQQQPGATMFANKLQKYIRLELSKPTDS